MGTSWVEASLVWLLQKHLGNIITVKAMLFLQSYKWKQTQTQILSEATPQDAKI